VRASLEIELTSLTLLLIATMPLPDLLCSAIPYASYKPKLLFQYLYPPLPFTACQQCPSSHPMLQLLLTVPAPLWAPSPCPSWELGRQLHQGSWFTPRVRRDRRARRIEELSDPCRSQQGRKVWLILNLPEVLLHQRTASNQEAGLSGEGYLELPIQALWQRLDPMGLRVVFCVICW